MPNSTVVANELLEIRQRLDNLIAAEEREPIASVQDASDGWLRDNRFRLARRAHVIINHRKKRNEYFDLSLFGEPAWDMLLDTYVHHVRGKRVSVTSVCLASQAPSTTALRYLKVMEEAGLLMRKPATEDRRVFYIELTESGLRKVGRYLASSAPLEEVAPSIS